MRHSVSWNVTCKKKGNVTNAKTQKGREKRASPHSAHAAAVTPNPTNKHPPPPATPFSPPRHPSNPSTSGCNDPPVHLDMASHYHIALTNDEPTPLRLGTWPTPSASDKAPTPNTHHPTPDTRHPACNQSIVVQAYGVLFVVPQLDLNRLHFSLSRRRGVLHAASRAPKMAQRRRTQSAVMPHADDGATNHDTQRAACDPILAEAASKHILIGLMRVWFSDDGLARERGGGDRGSSDLGSARTVSSTSQV